MSVFSRHRIVWRIASISIHLVVNPPAVPAMSSFEAVNIVQAAPAYMALEAILIMKIPTPEFPVPLEPAGVEPGPGIRVVMLYVVRPVLNLVRRSFRRAEYKKTGTKHQGKDRSFRQMTHICIHLPSPKFPVRLQIKAVGMNRGLI